MRVLVCGGHDYNDYGRLSFILDHMHAKTPITCVIQGEATGADALGKRWAIEKNIPHEDYPADWEGWGSKAGPMRNAQMLREGKPELVIALPGGPGTASMCRLAEGADVMVFRFSAGGEY